MISKTRQLLFQLRDKITWQKTLNVYIYIKRGWCCSLENRTANRGAKMVKLAYLKGENKPVWMVKGVPAMEKGINQGYDLVKW